MTGSADDEWTHAALGLELSSARYLRTLDRLGRCERVTRAAGLLGPLVAVVPGSVRGSVEVASADARVVLAKLWTAGERYRRVLDAVDRDPDQIDPGAGLSPAEFAALRRRLSGTPGRFDEGDYDAVAAAMAEARRAIRALLEAREADCEAFRGVDPDRLASAAATAARALTLEHEARREQERAGRRPDAEADHRTPVGNSDQIRPEALEAENVDPDLIAGLADDEEKVDHEELARALGTTRDVVAEFDDEDDAASAEEVIGAAFEISGAADDGEAGSPTPDGDSAPADGEDADESRFEFGVATESDESASDRD